MIPSIYGSQASGQVAPPAQDTQTVQQLADLNDRLKSDNYVLKIAAILGAGTATILGIAVYALTKEDVGTGRYREAMLPPARSPAYPDPHAYAPQGYPPPQGYAPRGHR